jgi:uncharacterized protein (TIGR00730 family)
MLTPAVEGPVSTAGARISICVFCGSRPGNSPAVVDAARELGGLIATRGHRLVYGAGGTGVMGTVAEAASAHHGSVVGVVPAFLRERERGFALVDQELVITDDLFDRKREMFARADAFVALPGGYGTVDEVLEVVSAGALGLHSKPLALIDVDGAWSPLVQLLLDLDERGFALPRGAPLFELVGEPAEALDLIEADLGVLPGRLPDRGSGPAARTAREGGR